MQQREDASGSGAPGGEARQTDTAPLRAWVNETRELAPMAVLCVIFGALFLWSVIFGGQAPNSGGVWAHLQSLSGGIIAMAVIVSLLEAALLAAMVYRIRAALTARKK